jgi:hypothetical protein
LRTLHRHEQHQQRAGDVRRDQDVEHGRRQRHDHHHDDDDHDNRHGQAGQPAGRHRRGLSWGRRRAGFACGEPSVACLWVDAAAHGLEPASGGTGVQGNLTYSRMRPMPTTGMDAGPGRPCPQEVPMGQLLIFAALPVVALLLMAVTRLEAFLDASTPPPSSGGKLLLPRGP